MKINKEVKRVGKQLFRACFVDDQFDQKKALSLVHSIIQNKPRNHVAILSHFGRLVRLETEKRTATIETAGPLQGAIQEEVKREIARRYPQVLRTNFGVKPNVLGGMRIRVGSDVWDGTLSGRLEALKNALS
jgi:F-type H+-transporting ATPase subunit delta